MQVAPSEAIMVAAHAYDLRAAKTVSVSLFPGVLSVFLKSNETVE